MGKRQNDAWSLRVWRGLYEQDFHLRKIRSAGRVCQRVPYLWEDAFQVYWASCWGPGSPLHHHGWFHCLESMKSWTSSSCRMAGHFLLLCKGLSSVAVTRCTRMWSMEKLSRALMWSIAAGCWALPGGLEGKTWVPKYRIPPGSILPKRRAVQETWGE